MRHAAVFLVLSIGISSLGTVRASDAVTLTLTEDDAETAWLRGRVEFEPPQEGLLPVHLDNGRSALTFMLVDLEKGKVSFQEKHSKDALYGLGTVIYEQKVVSLADGRTLLKVPGERWKRCQTPDGRRFYVIAPYSEGTVEAYDAVEGKLLWRKSLRQPRGGVTTFELTPTPKGLLASGMRKLGQHKQASAVCLELLNAKGSTKAFVDLSKQASGSREPLWPVVEEVKGKRTPGYLQPDAENKKGQRGLLIRSLQAQGAS